MMKLYVRLLLIAGFELLLGVTQAQEYFLSATKVDARASRFLKDTRPQRVQYSREQSPFFESPATAALQSNSLSTLWIPVQIHIAQNGPYSHAIDFLALSYLLSDVNAGLRDANIQLYSCGPANLIDDSNVYGLFLSNQSILDNHDVPGKLNMYFVDELKSGINGPFYCGSSSYPGQGERVIFSTSCFGYSDASVMLHLLGQYLSLYPTQGPNGATPEFVDGSNCTTAGDEICDTPADPGLHQGGYMSGCNYAAPNTVQDPQGDTYQPDTGNYMSYASGTCRDHFSPQQMARMYYSAQNDRNYLNCSAAPGCSQVVDQFPYATGFENGLGNWNAEPFYRYIAGGEFAVLSGPTPTAGTGPNAAAEGLQYVFADADMVPSPAAIYPVAILESPCFDFTSLNAPQLTFQYHMNGAAVGSLFVQTSTDGGMNWVSQNGTLFNIGGDQGTSWHSQTIDLSTLTNESTVVIRFGVQFAGSPLGDVAIDDIVIGESASCASVLDFSVAATGETCYGAEDGTAVLSFVQSGTLPHTITWSNGATNTTQVGNLAPGAYSVTVEDANSCTDIQAFTINGSSQPLNLELVAIPTSTDANAAGDLTTTVTGGSTPYSYNWSDGSTTASLTAKASGNYYLTVTDAAGCTVNANVFLSTIFGCNNTKSNWPYYQALEGGTGLFKQNQDDDRSWKKRSGNTPTNNTGPAGAAEGTYYRYIESSGNGNPTKTAVLTTKKCLDLSTVSNPVFEFQYHMYGGLDMGSLEIQISTDGGSSWQPAIWKREGDQGNNWHSANVDLSLYPNQNMRLRIVGTTGTGNKSDIAIDDLYIGPATGSNAPIGTQYVQEDNTFNTATPAKLLQSAFPNPAHDRLTVQLNLPDNTRHQLHLVNIMGHTVKNLPVAENGVQTLEIEVADLPAGMYYLLIRSEEGAMETMPIVVNR